MTKYVLNKPNVSLAIEKDRSVGYTFATSVADLIDNSIGQGAASRIHMRFEIQPGTGDLTFYLADNGVGMDSDQLFTAMTSGSDDGKKKHELSKFGYGLKTASWAHAKRLVVVSRPETDVDNPCAAAWDLDHIQAQGDYFMEVLDPVPNVFLEFLDELDGKVSGTLVVWQKIDRLLHNYQDLEGKHRRKGLDRLLNDVRDHLSLVFHRYLDPEFSDAPTVQILINEDPVIPWDPFGEKFANFEQPSRKELSSGDKRPIVVTPYLLPRDDKWDREKGDYNTVIKRDNELQGFYLYRANRLLQMPSWLGLGKQEPHANLARVKIDLNPDWDEILHVDLKKASVAFPQQLKDELLKVRAAIVSLADKQRRRPQPGPTAGANHGKSEDAINRQKDGILRPDVAAVDEKSGTASIRNTHGEVSGIKLLKPKGLPVNIVVSDVPLTDGQLWEPVVVDAEDGGTDTALHISSQHEFYRRVYIPASLNEKGKIAMDMLFWALAQAELNQTKDAFKAVFQDFRFEITKALRHLAEELPPAENDVD